MPAIDINLKIDTVGGFDFKNNTGAAIPSGNLFRQGNLVFYVTGDTPVNEYDPANVVDAVAVGAIGHAELPGDIPIFRAPITAGVAFAVGELVEVLAGKVVKAGTADAVAVPLVTVGRAGPIDGASGSAGITAANGAATTTDTWLRVALIGNAEALLA